MSFIRSFIRRLSKLSFHNEAKPLEPQLAEYELTATTGLEPIAADEVCQKLNIKPVVEKGRIRVSYEGPVENLLKLRSINNVFVTIYSRKAISSEEMPNVENLEEFFTSVAEQCNWTAGLRKWKQLSMFDQPMKTLLTKDASLNGVQPAFRVTCNRFGDHHKFQSPDVCVKFGSAIDSKFGWPIKMKNYDLELLVNFYETDLNISITLTHKALDKRNIVDIGYTTLRATTCYAMLRLANLQAGDIVVDPMAGSGAIPVECLSQTNDNEWQVFSIAGELMPKQVHKCFQNINSMKKNNSTNTQTCDILSLNVKYLPFVDKSVDVFISDLPFGKRVGSKTSNLPLYAALLGEMARCARHQTGRAILLTHDKKAMKYGYSRNSSYWTEPRENFAKIGNLPCFIFIMYRTNVEYIAPIFVGAQKKD